MLQMVVHVVRFAHRSRVEQWLRFHQQRRPVQLWEGWVKKQEA